MKQKRIGKNWTQTDLGAKLGINSSAICKIENGSKVLSKKKLSLLSTVLDSSLSEIKEIYFADKLALELIQNECPDNTIERIKNSIKSFKAEA